MSVSLDFLSPSEILDRHHEWREHSSEQFELLCNSVRENGIVEPPLIDSEGRAVCGSLIVKVAKHLGLNSIPVLRVDHMSNEELRLYAVRVSKLAELSGYNEPALAIEMRELEELLNVKTFMDFGFEQGELDRIFGMVATDEEEDVDAIPDFDAHVPASSPGDCWLIGNHRLLCGDALLENSYLELMNGERASFVLSDVPYNLSANTISGNGRFKHDNFVMASGEMSPAAFTRFLTTAMRHMASNSVDGSLHAIFMSYHFLLELLRAGSIVYGRPKAMCTWVKKQGGQGSLFRSQTEFVVYFQNGTAPYRNNVQGGRFGRNRTNAWHYDGMNTISPERDELLKDHPTPKPVELLKDAILDVTATDDIVLDPFAGSGSIIVAAHQCDRRAYAMEIDPRYVDVTLRRVRKTLGIEPLRASDGLSFSELETRVLEGALVPGEQS